MTHEIVERDTVLRGVRIHWAECGAGEPTFLLVHGLGSSIAKWIDCMPHLARAGRVVALDMPGFGRSDVPPGPYTPQWLAGSVRMFAREMGIERPILVGNSLGGLIAMHHAATWPDEVRALVALAPTLPPPPGVPHDPKSLLKFGATLVPVLGDLGYAGYVRLKGPERFVRDTLAMNVLDPGAVPPATVARLVEEAAERLSRPEIRRRLMTATRALSRTMIFGRDSVARTVSRLRVPVLYLWGERDRLVPPSTGARWAERTPEGQMALLPGVSHNPQIEAPETFATAVAEYAAKLEALGA